MDIVACYLYTITKHGYPPMAVDSLKHLDEFSKLGFEKNIELSLDWILKNRYATDHPDPNLAGAVINTRLRQKKDKLWITQRDVGTTFGVRFLAAYYDYNFGERSLKPGSPFRNFRM